MPELRASDDGSTAAWPARVVSVLDPKIEKPAISGRIMTSPSWASCRQSQRSAALLMMAEILAAWARPRLSTEAGSTLNFPRALAPRWGGEIVGDLVAKTRAGPAPAPAAASAADAGAHPRHRLVPHRRQEQGAAAEGVNGARPLLGLGVAARPLRGSADSARKLAKWAGSAGRNVVFSADEYVSHASSAVA